MEVFALDMAVRETGAATVERSLGKMRAEAQKTAAVANTMGASVASAGNASARAGAKAAKGSLAFAGMARNMVASGNAASLMSGSIVEAGGHIARVLGSGGILAIASGVFVTTMISSFRKVREETAKEAALIVANTRRLFSTLSGLAEETDRDRLTQDIIRMQRGQAFVIGRQQLGSLSADQLQGALQERGLVRLRSELAQMEQEINSARQVTRQLALKTASERSGADLARLNTAQQTLNTLPAIIGAYKTEISNLERAASVALSTLGSLKVASDSAVAGLGSAVAGLGSAVDPLRPNASLGAGRGSTQAGGRVDASMAQLPASFGEQFRAMERQAREESLKLAQAIRETLATDLAMGLADGIAGGFAVLTGPGGTLGKAFRAFTGMLLGGIGDAMIKFGVASKGFALLQGRIMAALASLNPKGALIGSLAMIAIGGALKGAAAGMFSRGTGAGVGVSTIGGGGGTGGAFGGEGPTTRLIFGPTSAGLAAGLTPRVAPNITVIGPNDPTAQRAIEEILRKANNRGGFG